jgi:hypothetical protein
MTAKMIGVLFSLDNSIIRINVMIASANNERASIFVDNGIASMAKPRKMIWTV